MNASAVHPLHLTEQRVPGIRCFDQAAHGWRGVQAGGLAARSVNVPFQVRVPPSRLRAPVLPRDCRVPVALLLQRVERDEPP